MPRVYLTECTRASLETRSFVRPSVRPAANANQITPCTNIAAWHRAVRLPAQLINGKNCTD